MTKQRKTKLLLLSWLLSFSQQFLPKRSTTSTSCDHVAWWENWKWYSKYPFNKTYQSIQNWPFMLLTDDLHYEVWGNCLLFDRDEMSYQVIFLFSIFLTIPLTDLCLAFHNEEINFQTRLTSLLSYWVSKKDLRKYSLTTSYCWTTVFLSLNCWVFFCCSKSCLGDSSHLCVQTTSPWSVLKWTHVATI